MTITRRDFLNGVALSIVAGIAPISLLQAAPDKKLLLQMLEGNYPPALTGLRGNHSGSFYAPHSISRNKQVLDYDLAELLNEKFDLVIAGGGISGLATACFYQAHFGKDKKILILENHDDFGGHATRNEFQTQDGLLLGYGGSESLQSPRSLFSATSHAFLKDLGVDINELEKAFSVNFYPDLGLSRGVFFDETHFGVNKLVTGDPSGVVADEIPVSKRNGRPLKDFINDFPLSNADKNQLITLHEDKVDYLSELNAEQKEEWIWKHSYYDFLKNTVKLSSKAIQYFHRSTDDFLALSIDTVSCGDARLCGLPGFGGMKLSALSDEEWAELDDPYTFHFPDGNASLARIMVRKLIPNVAPGKSMQDVVLAKFNYDQLDLPSNVVKLRLNSCVLNAKNIEGGVQVAYMHKNQQLYRVQAKHAIMAGYNMMIPYIIPELPKTQKEALSANVKAPLIYTNVVVRNWQAFAKLGVHDIYCPTLPYSMVKLDFPVSMGGYQHPRDPSKPIVLHMVYAPTYLGSGLTAKEQFKQARHDLIAMPYEQHERMIRAQLQSILGGQGFKHGDDILAITVNRWSHGYSCTLNTLYDDEDVFNARIEVARKPFGRISIANADAAWNPYAHAAIDEAYRAVNELKKA